MGDTHFWNLPPPNLDDLMSMILGSPNPEEKLVFVEYDPMTCSFYDHVGMPGISKDQILSQLEKTTRGNLTYSELLDNIAEKMSDHFSNEKDIKQKILINLKESFKGLYEFLETTLPEKHEHLVLLDGLTINTNKTIAEDNLQDRLFDLVSWLFSRTPQRRDLGRSGNRQIHGWEDVNNSATYLNDFLAVAAFEFLFGMRVSSDSKPMQHMRINVILETGEYAGQIIAFTSKDNIAGEGDKEAERNELLKKAIEAATLVRRVLHGIRQARYVNAVLAGGKGRVDRILVTHLPYLVPVEAFYVRIDGQSNLFEWSKFFDDGTVYYHTRNDTEPYKSFSSKTRRESAENLDKQKPTEMVLGWLNKDGKKYDDVINESGTFVDCSAKNGEIGETEIEYSEVGRVKEQNFLFGFQIPGKEAVNGAAESTIVRVLGLADGRILPARTFTESGFVEELESNKHSDFLIGQAPKIVKETNTSDSKDNDSELQDQSPFSHAVVNDESNLSLFSVPQRKETLAARLNMKLAIMLEPGESLIQQIRQAQREQGQTYESRYGTAIFGKHYLNLDALPNTKSVADTILRLAVRTKDRLTNSLHPPFGYRAICRVIFDRFFVPAWQKLINKDEDPNLSREEGSGAKKHTPLGNLIYQALDFEDTLHLDGGYREHFVHSFHVFLVGLYIMRELTDLNKHLEDENDLAAWFLASFLHDVAYPLERIEKISQEYVKRLVPERPAPKKESQRLLKGREASMGLRPDYGRFLASSLLIHHLQSLVDSFIRQMFSEDDASSDRAQLIKAILNNLKDETGNSLDFGRFSHHVKGSLLQHAYDVAIESGEHGLLSSLLVRHTGAQATPPPKWNLVDEVSVAIFSHHMLDRSSIASKKKNPSQPIKHKWRLPGTWPNLNDIGTLPQEDREALLGFAFPLFAFNLSSNNRTQWLSALLILADTLAQWGRRETIPDHEDTRLRPRATTNSGAKEPLLTICYAGVSDPTEIADTKKNFFDSVFLVLTSQTKTPVILQLTYKCRRRGNKNPPTPEDCGDCSDWECREEVDKDKMTVWDKERLKDLYEIERWTEENNLPWC